jgi:hypothetical protein
MHCGRIGVKNDAAVKIRDTFILVRLKKTKTLFSKTHFLSWMASRRNKPAGNQGYCCFSTEKI